MRAVRWRWSPSAKGPGFGLRGFSLKNESAGEPATEHHLQVSDESPSAYQAEMPVIGRHLLEQVLAEADREGLEPARLIFREAGLVAADSLSRPHFFAALQRVALRCEAGHWKDGDYARDVIELVFRWATTDGQNVSQSQLATIFAEIQKSRGSAASRSRNFASSDKWSSDSGEELTRGLEHLRLGTQLWVLNDADAVVCFCRRAGIRTIYDHEWRRSAGQSVEVLQVDTFSQTVKCRTAFGSEVWFSAAALPATGVQAPQPPLPHNQAALDGESGADYAVFRPLVEDIDQHRMTVREAFDVLREGRPGISERALRGMMDTYSSQETPEARRRACARAWALARMDSNGEISFQEFERLVARARATIVSSSGAVAGTPWGTVATRTPPPQQQGAAPNNGAATRPSPGGQLRMGDQVMVHVLVQRHKSAHPTSARVEQVGKDSIDVVFGSGARQRVPRDWVVQEAEATFSEEADGSESRSDTGDSSSHTDSKELGTWAGKLPVNHGAVPGGPGLVGLENLGNSCYMNSILQCLAGTVDLVRSFLGSGSMERDLNPDNKLGSGGSVAKEFAALLGLLWGGKQPGFCRPSRFKATVIEAAEQFSGSEQQDAQEFAAYLLDVLHEDLNRVRGRKPAVEFPDLGVLTQEGEERAAAECWSLYLKRDKSIIVDIFQGQLRSQIRCSRCNFLSTKFDSFMYLSLPVVDASGVPLCSLGDCLREFAREERLSGDERWYCPRCRERVEATKALTVWKLPTVLLVHLKRFRFESGAGPGPNWCGGKSPWMRGAQKLSHNVDFDLEGLDLGELGALPPTSPQKSEPVFDLFALVDHFGACGYGHYTAVVWHEGAGRWHRFDDDCVAALDAAEVRSDKAYLLFFRRRGGVIRAQTRSAPESWPHRINTSWTFLRSDQNKDL